MEGAVGLRAALRVRIVARADRKPLVSGRSEKHYAARLGWFQGIARFGDQEVIIRCSGPSTRSAASILNGTVLNGTVLNDAAVKPAPASDRTLPNQTPPDEMRLNEARIPCHGRT